jgi:hypothetical protein
MKSHHWYNKNKKLGFNIDKLKNLPFYRRNHIVQGIMCLMKQHEPDLLEEFVLDFPLEINRRRWYDDDPYLWLIINGLRYGSKQLHQLVFIYLEKEMNVKNGRIGSLHAA